MNKKILSAAVSAVVAAGSGVAHAGISVYGRVNNAIDIKGITSTDATNPFATPNAESTTDISGVVSRFGLRGNTNLGNGLAAHAHLEFGVTSDKERGFDDLNADNAGGTERVIKDDIRFASAGLSGAFGRIDVGNLWSAYSATFGTLVSPTYTLGYYLYSSVGGGLFRESNAIQYSNSWGPVDFRADLRLNDSGDGSNVAEVVRGNGFGLGATYQVIPNLILAAAYDVDERDGAITGGTFTADNEANNNILATFVRTTNPAGSLDQTRLGLSGKYTFGSTGYWVSTGYQNYSTDQAEVSITAATGAINTADSGAPLTTDTTVNLPETDVTSLFLYGGGSIGPKTSWMLGYASADDGVEAGTARFKKVAGVRQLRSVSASEDSTQIIWALYHNVGGGLRLYYESVTLESENKGWDGSRHLLGIRVDF